MMPYSALNGQNAQNALVNTGLRKRAVGDGGLDGVERGLQIGRHEDHVASGGKGLDGGIALRNNGR